MPLHFADLADQQQTLVLDLPDPLASDPEFFPDLAERVPLAIPHARAHPQDVRSAVV